MRCAENAALNSPSCTCAGSRSRQRELITISDDSDEEPAALVPCSPVLVTDDDDDISILEVTNKQCFKSELCISQRLAV